MTNENERFGRRSVLRAVGAVAGLAVFGAPTSATPGSDSGPNGGEVLVGVAASADGLESEVERYVPGNARVVHSNEELRYVAVKFPGRAPAHARENFIEAITRKEHIRYAEPNATLDAVAVNDPLYGYQYAPAMIGCEEAWESTLGDPSISIAVVDQGIQHDHPDLAETYETGYDFVENDDDPYAVSANENHGTHVAGIAAGGTDDGTGHAGISNCSLLSARALDERGSGSVSDIADAIVWSTNQGASVINLSVGGGSYTETLKNAVSYALSNGSLPIAAAGNDGRRSVFVSGRLRGVSRGERARLRRFSRAVLELRRGDRALCARIRGALLGQRRRLRPVLRDIDGRARRQRGGRTRALDLGALRQRPASPPPGDRGGRRPPGGAPGERPDRRRSRGRDGPQRRERRHLRRPRGTRDGLGRAVGLLGFGLLAVSLATRRSLPGRGRTRRAERRSTCTSTRAEVVRRRTSTTTARTRWGARRRSWWSSPTLPTTSTCSSTRGPATETTI